MDRFAYELDIINKKYTKNLQMYKNDQKKERKIFTEEEISFLWDHLDMEDVDLVLILLYTGMRSGELPEVKLDNIYLDENYLTADLKQKLEPTDTFRFIPG